jgi:hypothetical protein
MYTLICLNIFITFIIFIIIYIINLINFEFFFKNIFNKFAFNNILLNLFFRKFLKFNYYFFKSFYLPNKTIV